MEYHRRLILKMISKTHITRMPSQIVILANHLGKLVFLDVRVIFYSLISFLGLEILLKENRELPTKENTAQ